MITYVQKWGDDLALRIPEALAAELEWDQDAPVSIAVEGGRLVIEQTTAPRYELEDLLALVTEDNIHPETQTGPAVGKEVW